MDEPIIPVTGEHRDTAYTKHKQRQINTGRKPLNPVAEIIQTREVLDRLWCISDNITTWLLEHPTIKQRDAWNKKIQQARGLLSEVFQEAGAM